MTANGLTPFVATILMDYGSPVQSQYAVMKQDAAIYISHVSKNDFSSARVKGAMRFGTFKSIDFKKNWYVKVPVVPRSLML